MRRTTSLVFATLVLSVVLALIAATGYPSHAIAGQPANSESAALKVITVEIREFSFAPATVTVHEGDTVQWKNDDSVLHTATEDVEDKKPAFDSGNIQTGASWRYVAQKKGTYNYICTLHPNMHGKLIVE
jgi:plastocyanin